MPAIHAFIDTNVFLNFYSFPDDKSSVLGELISLLGQDKINLHLPRQVEDEYWRNRESKIHAAVVDFRNANLPTAVPNHMRGAETARQYHDAIESASNAKKKLIGNVIGLAVLQQLEVDVQIEGVFSAAIKHDDCEQALARAISRMHKGNPPGKPGNVGDRYNWETLLAMAPEQDIYVVTKDGDFTSPLGSLEKTTRPMAFLAKEWAAKAPGKSVYIYQSIQAFLDHYKKLEAQPEPAPLVNSAPEVLVPPMLPPAHDGEMSTTREAAQEAKEQAIEVLANSKSFYQTHLAIASLTSMIPLLTVKDAEKLFEAALENQQISWIISDTDVNSFFVEVLNKHLAAAEGGLVDAMIELLGLKADDESDEEID